MARLCLGFEVHQPFRLNPEFRPEMAKGRRDLEKYYFAPSNQENLGRVAERCYLPATEILLDALDDGLRCALSFSGTVLEQLERWSPDTLALFAEAGRHPHTEVLAQTYYHSLVGFFEEPTEFVGQVQMHARLMEDLFGKKPRVAENTEFALNNTLAAAVRDLGYLAVYTEGAGWVLGEQSPNEPYTCQGLQVLMRNCPLSDDIGFRFSWEAWDKYPLAPETYAWWVAASPGTCAHVFLDYETFGEHHQAGTGIFTFLEDLYPALEDAGVACLLPSEAAALPSAGDLDLPWMVSWADMEKDGSAWLGNPRQRSAFFALEQAQARTRRPDLWRYFGTSDHFYYLSSKDGACGDVHTYFCPDDLDGQTGAYEVYMRVLSHLDSRSLPRGRQALASVPAEKAFHFFFPDGSYTGRSAHSLLEFWRILPEIPEVSVLWHLHRGDYARWLEGVFGERRLAHAVAACLTPGEVRDTVERRWSELCRD
ncbi:alpha-amylase [Methanofollis sp. W23]|uniref:glycoside hydrolase family 57 protein n=1 Tax=Methanofollis sp. W23 TaxID=2817849 RepID=UPI001AE971A1|nr:glycoside hydrolase family 57 protein [Methanofollis sp. W23]MBP2146589.1 alpha-amylase [Methanofollis sp. W23]